MLAHPAPCPIAMRTCLPAAALLAVTLAACSGQATAPADAGAAPAQADRAQSQGDAAFAELSRRYLDEAMALSPVAATQIGGCGF